jgi:predicted lipase
MIVGLSAAEDRPARSRVRIRPQPADAETPVDRLRLGWNSEAEADWPAADVLALISELAYLTPAAAEPKYRALGFDRVRPFAEEPTSGYVLSADEVAVIAFSGTQDLAEWLINLDLLSHYTPHGNIHAGYYKAYLSMKPQILEQVERSHARKIWITGHSLGGALAVACAYDFTAHEHIRLHGLMTFGQPMVADKYLANYLDQRLVGRYAHVVNGLDIVPRLPPGYTHAGSLVWFSNGQVLRSPPKRPSRKL